MILLYSAQEIFLSKSLSGKIWRLLSFTWKPRILGKKNSHLPIQKTQSYIMYGAWFVYVTLFEKRHLVSMLCSDAIARSCSIDLYFCPCQTIALNTHSRVPFCGASRLFCSKGGKPAYWPCFGFEVALPWPCAGRCWNLTMLSLIILDQRTIKLWRMESNALGIRLQ